MTKNLEKILLNINPTGKVILFTGSLLLGLLAGKFASYYDNINETNNILTTLVISSTLIYLSCIEYITKGKERRIKDNTDAIVNNTISYVAPLTGMLMSYFT